MRLLPAIAMLGAAFAAQAQSARVLDDFSEASHWHVVASNQVSASTRVVDDGADGKALCLDYDFNGVSGYAGIRRELPLDYPDNWRFDFRLKGASPRNDLQFKLIDDSGDNVWWVNSTHFGFSQNWQHLSWRKREIVKAWGPGSDAMLHHSAALEFTIYKNAAGGEKGTACFATLRFEQRPASEDVPLPPTPNEQITALAKKSPRGTYPRSFSGEQNYWTLLGVDGGSDTGLMNEDGEIELGTSQPSIAPTVSVDGKKFTWADVDETQAGRHTRIVTWTRPQFHLNIYGFAQGKPGDSQIVAVYQLQNDDAKAHDFVLSLALQPYQVNPPQQFLNTPGGVADIGSQHVLADGGVIDAAHPQREYRFHLEPGQVKKVVWVSPLEGKYLRPANFNAHAAYWQVEHQWHAKLGSLWLRTNDDKTVQTISQTLESAQAQILMSRDGPMLRPGTRSYARSWIRDGAMMSEALLRTGHADVVRDYLRWYVRYQFKDGMVPCCVDARGADPVPENDSHGELIHAIAEYWRYTGDKVFLRQMWPHVLGAYGYMETLRLSERTQENRTKNPAFFGLMPTSISHEGYSAKPMHSYWDDAWALRGYVDAVEIANALAETDASQKMAKSRDEFRGDVQASLASAMQQHGITYLPGCAELGDFDPTSSTMWYALGLDADIPRAALDATWQQYWAEFDTRMKGTRPWKDFTPYEWRNVAAFVRLGWRERADEVAQFFFDHQQPKGWNQWAEVVSSTPRKPFFLGDLPHAWVASDFIRSALDMFAYVDDKQTLILAAGVPWSWLQGEGIAVGGLRTPYGTLGYSLKRDTSGRLELHVDAGVRVPPGGIVLRLQGKDVHIPSLPADMQITD